ncbi:hypothetical protein BV898_17051 [Hypsibius exemplaris]|uniref:Uncharacterized protein n=1 Tax=Hypsibius exemplaris TaxID=2072580 RepID=A0A9X6NEC1_HYPEX|nr:hypothetical protein BV898_17051 [Hypsibius exemplaris]
MRLANSISILGRRELQTIRAVRRCDRRTLGSPDSDGEFAVSQRTSEAHSYGYHDDSGLEECQKTKASKGLYETKRRALSYAKNGTFHREERCPFLPYLVLYLDSSNLTLTARGSRSQTPPATYCCSVWSPGSVKWMNEIAGVERSALRAMNGYRSHLDEELFAQLKITPVFEHGKVAETTPLFKIRDPMLGKLPKTSKTLSG